MIKIEYSKKFLKDLKKLKKKNRKFYEEIKKFCFITLPAIKDVDSISKIKKLKNHNIYFRIRINKFRIGLKKINDNKIQLLRVLHRKDIYTYFPLKNN